MTAPKKPRLKTFAKVPGRMNLPDAEHIGRGRYSPAQSPLMEAMRNMSSGEKEIMCMEVGTSLEYLYQVAGNHRRNISISMAFRIEEATKMLHASNPDIPVVTGREMYEHLEAMAG